MDTIENLIIAIVKPLISQPDALTIKIEDTPEFLEYHLDLDQSDVGRVIGRKGRTISAIRTIVYSVPTEDKKVRIVIDEKIKGGTLSRFFVGCRAGKLGLLCSLFIYIQNPENSKNLIKSSLETMTLV